MKARQCVAAGTYDGSDGNNQALVARLSGDTWTTASVEQPTTYNRFNSNGASVSCTPGYCAVGGYTLTAASPVHDSSLLLAAPAAVSNPPATIVSDSSVQVSWTAPSDRSALPISGYVVTANDLTHAPRGSDGYVGPGGGATFRSLDPMDTYTFTVRATSLLGTGLRDNGEHHPPTTSGRSGLRWAVCSCRPAPRVGCGRWARRTPTCSPTGRWSRARSRCSGMRPSAKTSIWWRPVRLRRPARRREGARGPDRLGAPRRTPAT